MIGTHTTTGSPSWVVSQTMTGSQTQKWPLKTNTRWKQPSNLSSLDSLLTTAEAKVNPLWPVLGGPEINYRWVDSITDQQELTTVRCEAVSIVLPASALWLYWKKQRRSFQLTFSSPVATVAVTQYPPTAPRCTCLQNPSYNHSQWNHSKGVHTVI